MTKSLLVLTTILVIRNRVCVRKLVRESVSVRVRNRLLIVRDRACFRDRDSVYVRDSICASVCVRNRVRTRVPFYDHTMTVVVPETASGLVSVVMYATVTVPMSFQCL